MGKRVWMAEQRTEAENQKEAEKRQEYDREQELYNNKALLSKESKEKLELNFMYEPHQVLKKKIIRKMGMIMVNLNTSLSGNENGALHLENHGLRETMLLMISLLELPSDM